MSFLLTRLWNSSRNRNNNSVIIKNYYNISNNLSFSAYPEIFNNNINRIAENEILVFVTDKHFEKSISNLSKNKNTIHIFEDKIIPNFPKIKWPIHLKILILDTCVDGFASKFLSNLPQNLEILLIKAQPPYNMHIQSLNMQPVNIYDIIWPFNLKKIYIELTIFNNQEIGILPYGLKELTIICKKIANDNFINLPESLTQFTFECVNISDNEYMHFNWLPDNIKTLCISYNAWKNVEKIPDKCEKFKYVGCSNEYLQVVKLKFPNRNIYI